MNPHTKQAHASHFGAKGTSACYGVRAKEEFLTTSPAQTKKIGERLAREILKKKLKKTAFVIGLKGELGGGKTTFLQGFAKGLGIKERILSPTFVILKRFKIKSRNFYHIDCYRIQKPKEILDLGFKEIISNPENIVVIEWADRIKKIMPKDSAWIKFDFVDEKTRKIIFFERF